MISGLQPLRKGSSLCRKIKPYAKAHLCDIIRHYLKKNNEDVVATAKALDIGIYIYIAYIYKMIRGG